MQRSAHPSLSMIPSLRQRVVVALAAILLGIYALHSGAKFFLYRVEQCDQPCRWQGSERGYGSCAPLDARLEMRTTPNPQGGLEAVWYRVTVTNKSCETLQLPTEFMMYSQHGIWRTNVVIRGERLPTGVRVVIRDATGRELPEKRDNSARGIGEDEKDIHPYGRDYAALDVFVQQIDKPRTQFSNRSVYAVLAVPPRKTVTTSPTILWPHRMVHKEVSTPDYVGSTNAPEVVNMPDAAKRFAVPPEGFRRMDEYELTKPGVYSAEFIFDYYVGLKLHHRRSSYPKWALAGLWFLAGGEPEPRPYNGHVSVKVSSGKVPFKVKR